MIKVARAEIPAVLRRNSRRWLRALSRLRLRPDASPAEIERATNQYRKEEVKDILKEMFHGKCAYCESCISVVTYGEIEHFWPKSIYPERTFDWSNLLLSCPICNSAAHKGARFPLDATGQPLLIDPTDARDDPAFHLEFRWDPNGEQATVYGVDVRGQEVERVFDLNGQRDRADLAQRRNQHVAVLALLHRRGRVGDGEAQALFDAACGPDYPWSAFARALAA